MIRSAFRILPPLLLLVGALGAGDCQDGGPPPEAEEETADGGTGGGTGGGVGEGEETPDAGAPGDDAGADAGAAWDAGAPWDGGGWEPDAGPPVDAGAPDAGDVGGGATACDLPGEWHRGVTSFYNPGTGPACGYAGYGEGALGVAVPNEVWADVSICGSCLEVAGPVGTLVVKVQDQCPDCPAGQLDMTREAFGHVGVYSRGVEPIEWRVVPCPVEGTVSFRWDGGSQKWWWRLWVRDHRTPLASLEWRGMDGAWHPARREWGGYVAEPSGGDDGPYDLRLTDTLGRVIVEEDVPLLPGEVVEGTVQFPPCE